MIHFDDIFNVYAYLFSKSRENLEASESLMAEIQETAEDYEALEAHTDRLLDDAEDLLEQAYALAKQAGIDLTDLGNAEETPAPAPKRPTVSADFTIELPEGFDFQADFERLVQEANAAGFTDVHPEDLLSEDELKQAENFAEHLDDAFCQATALNKKDLVVLVIAVAVRTVCSLLMNKSLAKQPEAAPEPPEMDRAAQLYSKAWNTGTAYVQQAVNSFLKPMPIRDRTSILKERPPFDLADNAAFSRKDIAGYDKYLGWIIGVVNIMTDTVTTYGLKSYSVTRPENGAPLVNEEVSTLLRVVHPVAQGAPKNKEAIVAAVVQEAIELDFADVTAAQADAIFGRAVELEKQTKLISQQTSDVLAVFKKEWAEAIGGVAAASLVNTIVAAVHALLYDESDGDVQHYALRTSKIITYSSAISTLLGSIPAIAAQDPTKVDYTGILTTCLSMFHSIKFWTELKTQFLASAYKQEIDREMEKLDRYFHFS